MRPPAASAFPGRSRIAALVAALCAVAVAAAVLANTFTARGPAWRAPAAARAVTADEAALLAHLRLHNYEDRYAGLRAVIRSAAGDVHLAGWVDWQRPLIYIDSVAAVPGPADGLVQAVPGLVAVRTGRLPATAPGTPSARPTPPYPDPPAVPPTDGWRVRPLVAHGPAGSAFDTLLALLFAMSSRLPDDAARLAATGARFVREDMLGGVPVAVLLGPAVPPTGGSQPSAAATRSATDWASAGTGDQVQYWVDGSGRLRRLDALLAAGLPVQVDFERDDRTAPLAVDVLGGRPVLARPIRPAEARLLSKMVQRGTVRRGGRVTVTVPVSPAGLVRAEGWLNWRRATVYLAVHNPDDATQDGLLRADRYGLSTLERPYLGGTAGQPPPHPPGRGWRTSGWAQREGGGGDLDVLVSGVLSLTRTYRRTDLRRAASFLRRDTLGGVPVVVLAVRPPYLAGGIRPVRCWLDGAGVLRRLEVRTHVGAFAYLDIMPGPVPPLPARP